MSEQRAAAAPGHPFPAPEAQHRERTLRPSGAVLHHPAGGLCGVLDDDRPELGRQVIHLGQIEGTPVQVHDHDDSGSEPQRPPQAREVGRERLGIGVIQNDGHAGPCSGRGQVVARKGG